MRDPAISVEGEEFCVCGHMPAAHQYEDGAYKPDCDECCCKAYRPDDGVALLQESGTICPEGVKSFAQENMPGSGYPDFRIADARTPKDCRHEPPYEGITTVLFAISAPELTAHAPTDRCVIEQPHGVNECGGWMGAGGDRLP